MKRRKVLENQVKRLAKLRGRGVKYSRLLEIRIRVYRELVDLYLKEIKIFL
jgi:hypothetical protein